MASTIAIYWLLSVTCVFTLCVQPSKPEGSLSLIRNSRPVSQAQESISRRAAHVYHKSDLSLPPPNGIHLVHECGNGYLFLGDCSDNEVIQVVSATYGKRNPMSNCHHVGNVTNTVCSPLDALARVRGICYGNSTCNIPVRDVLPGNPCAGQIQKCVNVMYKCGLFGRSQEQCACENEPLVIQCDSKFGDGIVIRGAKYQASNGGCNDYASICPDIDVQDYFSDLCESKNSCKSIINTTEIGHGDLCHSLESYLEIKYTCEEAVTDQPINKCPDGIHKFATENDTAIVHISDLNATKEYYINRCNFSSSFEYSVGVTYIKCRLLNEFGRYYSCIVQVNVTKDTEPPIITCPPNYSFFAPPGQTSFHNYVNFTAVQVSDNSGDFGNPSCSPQNVHFEIGVTDIYCTVKDKGGNTGTCLFQVTVIGRCPEEKFGVLSWQETMAGDVTESLERCPVRTEGRNLASAKRQCIYNETSGGVWGAIIDTECGDEETPGIEDLSGITVTEDNVEDVTEVLSNIIASSNENEEEIDISIIQGVFSDIVSVQSASPKVTEGVIGSINHILNANISKASGNEDSANSSSVILQLLEQQIAQTLLEHGQFESIKPNIVVAGFTVNASDVESGAGLDILQSDSGFQDDGSIVERISSIQLPTDIFSLDDDVQVSFIGYNDDSLFQSEMLEDKNTTMDVFGPIISAVVVGFDVNDTEQPVVIHFSPSKDEQSSAVLNTSRCVSWDFSLRDGIGDWSAVGCELVSADSGGITCHCNHLTNFAVLVDFSGQHVGRPTPGTFAFALDVISKIGCAFSVIALCITLMIFFLCSRLRISLQRKILIQFCISMLCLYLSFLIGIDSKSQSGCLLAGFLLHYFVLSTMFWMGVEARHMYITLVSESGRVGRKFMIKAGLFAWGGALIPVGVVFAVKQDEYLADSYCFVAPDYGLYFGLLLPVALVIFHNTITFALVAKTLLSSKSYALKPDVEEDIDDKTDASDVGQRLLNAFSVSIIFGLTWVFGFLAVEEARRVFQLLFCIFNSFQGVLIFILFCYAQKDVRRILMRSCCSESHQQPRAKKPKKPVDNEGKPLPVNATSMSSSTRVTGESYSDDGETLITKLDDATLPMTTLEFSETDNQMDDDNAESCTIKAEVKGNAAKELISDETESTLVKSETDNSTQPIINP